MLLNILLALPLIHVCFAQFAVELHPISRCLDNCAHCLYNQLDICIGDKSALCIPNYEEHSNSGSCTIDSIYQKQIVIINSTGKFQMLNNWEFNTTTMCHYVRANGKNESVSVLGLFSGFESNTLTLDIKAYYQTMLVSFNLVRNTWIPFVDLLQIVISDESDKNFGDYLIEYFEREEVNEKINRIRCNEEALINEKFQFQVDFRHKNITKVMIRFSGLMFGDELWGLTNLKVAFGCQNNLYYNGKSCLNCESGFYLDKEHVIKEAPTCHKCPSNCLSCNKTQCFVCAEGMIPKQNHCQSGQGFKLYPSIYDPSSQFCGVHMLHSHDQSQVHKQTIEGVEISIPDPHQNARLIFDLYLTDTQWNNESALIIEVDGKQVKRIRETMVHGRLRQKCDEFAVGYFSQQKIITPYFLHTAPTLLFRLYSSDTVLTDFGIADVSIEIQLDLNPENKSSPQIKPQPQPQPQPLPSPQPQPQPQPQPSPQPQPQPSPLPAQNSTNNGTNSEPPADPVKQKPQIVERKKTISAIEKVKDKVKITHNTFHSSENAEMLININYPMRVNTYPFIKCYFMNEGKSYPAKMVNHTHHLQTISVLIKQSILNETVRVVMTAYENTVAQKRNLQADEEVELGVFSIKRYDMLDLTEVSSLESFQTFFFTIAWIFIISSMIFLMLGRGAYIVDSTLAVQAIFLHIYINGEFLPSSFKIPISGLQEMENLNYFSNSNQKSIEKGLMGNVVQESPIRFTEFDTDINFTRGVYPIIIFNLILVAWFLILSLLSRCFKKRLFQSEEEKFNDSGPTCSQKFMMWIITITDQKLGFWHYVLKYQFMTIIWLSFLQFFNMKYPDDANRNGTINSILCVACFIFSLGFPILGYLVTKHYYYKMEYEEYFETFKGMFIFQLYDQSLPSNHHRYLILLHALRILISAVCFCYLGNSPIQALVILIIIHILSILYLELAKPILQRGFKILFIIEFVLLIILQILMLVSYGTSDYLNKNQYFVIGYVMVFISILVIVNCIVRVLYVFYREKTHIYSDSESFKGQLAAHRVV